MLNSQTSCGNLVKKLCAFSKTTNKQFVTSHNCVMGGKNKYNVAVLTALLLVLQANFRKTAAVR